MDRPEDIAIHNTLGEHTDNPPHPKQTGYPIIEEDGTQWKVSEVEQRIKGQFELTVLTNAIREIEALAPIVGNPEIMQKYRAAFIHDKEAKKYHWGGECIRNAIGSEQGIVWLMFLCLQRCHPDITEEKVRELAENYPDQYAQALKWALGDHLKKGELKKGTTSPSQK